MEGAFLLLVVGFASRLAWKTFLVNVMPFWYSVSVGVGDGVQGAVEAGISVMEDYRHGEVFRGSQGLYEAVDLFFIQAITIPDPLAERFMSIVVRILDHNQAIPVLYGPYFRTAVFIRADHDIVVSEVETGAKAIVYRRVGMDDR